MLAARLEFGDGLYGSSASLENSPHLRTPCWACNPRTFLGYPLTVDTREKTFAAESGPNSITRWYLEQGMPAIMVCPSGNYWPEDWRKPDNIFRRGDQSNCYIRDRHHDWYEQTDPVTKSTWEKDADGKNQQVY
jgi:hypothetical protein